MKIIPGMQSNTLLIMINNSFGKTKDFQVVTANSELENLTILG